MRAPLVALAFALSAAPLVAQEQTGNPNLERIANDAYSRSHDFDLVHQRIAVRDFNWDSLSFTGRVASTLVSRKPALDSVIFDAGARLAIRSVTAGARTLRTARHGDTLVIHLARPAAFGDTVRFTIEYDARITNGRGLTFIDERPHTPRQIWSQGEDMDNHFWFPTYDFPNDKMTWEVDATVPKGYTAVSNGALAGDTPGPNGTHTLHWNEARPSATYLVSLIVTRLAKVHDTWKGVPVDYYVYPQDSALAWRLFHVTPDMIDTYSRLTGVPYPWQKYAQTTVADFFGGMENVSATTLVDWLPDARAYQDRPWYQYILIPHELAHQWFGDYVTTENWANTWLNEGFAEFMPGQYWAQTLGAHAEQDYYADEYRQFMNIEARRPMPLASMGSNNIYPKGALVLEMLKHSLGDQPFWASLHRYLVDHSYGNATTDDLRQAVLDATGQNLDWFWKEWIYGAGYPSFTVTSSYDATARRLTLVAAQTQTDSLKADSTGMRYVIPEAFTMPITIRVGTASGDVVDSMWIRRRVDTIVVDGVRSAPTMVVFDDGNRMLKALDFDEPTAWLATQLQRDADLWDREWVIGQLAKRPTDAAAGGAIAKAATSADYPLTRAQAAAALDAFPPDVSVPALRTAIHDTSAQVRAAAAATLGGIPAPQALTLARDAWQHDSSYQVRASALSSLIRLDSLNRHSALLEGLNTASYQDAIQNAALIGIARSNDAAALDDVQRHVGDQSLPARVIAAFAARGNQHALDLLASDLNDDRSWVRTWTLTAVGSLPPQQRLAFLEAQLPKLTHADTRSAVQQAIDALRRASPR
ncbi:MAG TPA: M1 family aminopeptidase [Gemmatimonadaceae bacterium]|nr:M1 family aminopeptidase [Gemmatimonadaceae bacterium]